MFVIRKSDGTFLVSRNVDEKDEIVFETILQVNAFPRALDDANAHIRFLNKKIIDENILFNKKIQDLSKEISLHNISTVKADDKSTD